MENSPLELYETAYRLHYVENRIPEALHFYEALIKEFPESNESGYAVIQIQKIKANNIADSLHSPKTKLHPLVIASFILNLLLLSILGAGAFYFFNRMEMEHKYTSLATRAIVKMNNSNYEEALELLNEMKILSKEDITPFELSATIYQKQGDLINARSEYEVFYSLNPDQRGESIDVLVPSKSNKKSK
ncbi:MAG: tetratricopeptide repeat protein [Chitinispirillaceae bacterium]